MVSATSGLPALSRRRMSSRAKDLLGDAALQENVAPVGDPAALLGVLPEPRQAMLCALPWAYCQPPRKSRIMTIFGLAPDLRFWINLAYFALLVLAAINTYFAWRLRLWWLKDGAFVLLLLAAIATWAFKMYEDLFTQCP
jgi:hypothetical protein